VRREVWDKRGDKLLRVDNAEPECGQNFCDRCGDCLHCYGYHHCVTGGAGDDENVGHRWVQYGEPSEEVGHE
jgi:hypothetical protein